jgi:hypothetical protein
MELDVCMGAEALTKEEVKAKENLGKALSHHMAFAVTLDPTIPERAQTVLQDYFLLRRRIGTGFGTSSLSALVLGPETALLPLYSQ